MHTGSQVEFTPAQKKWFDGLNSCRAGRSVVEHLSLVNALVSSPRKLTAACPVETYVFRVCLLRGLQKSRTAFNLPPELPNVICILNLSGARCLVYTSERLLVELLCSVGPESGKETEEKVATVVEQAKKRKACLLLCLSLPFQAGVEQVFWEIRLLSRSEKNGETAVVDGGMSLIYGISERPKPASNTLDTCCMDEAALQEMEAEFGRTFSACCLDDPEPAAAREAAKGEKREELARVLQLELKNRTAELRTANADHVEDLKRKDEKADQRVAAAIAKTEKIAELHRKKEEELNALVASLRAQLADAVAAKSAAAAAKAEAELLASESARRLKERAKVAEAAQRAAEAKAAAAARENDRGTRAASSKAEEERSALIARAEAAEAAQAAEKAALEEMSCRASALESLVETVKAESEAASYETVAGAKRLKALEREAAASARKKAAAEAAAAEAEAVAAATAAELAAARRRLLMSSAALAFARAKRGPACVDAGANTEPFVDSHVSELEAELGSANARLEALEKQLAEAKAEAEAASKSAAEEKRLRLKAAKPRPPEDCLPEVAGVVGVPLKGSAESDIALEALISQIASLKTTMDTSLEALANVARGGVAERQRVARIRAEL